MDGAHAGCLPAVANTDILDEGPFGTFIINSRITAIGDPKRRAYAAAGSLVVAGMTLRSGPLRGGGARRAAQTAVGWCHCSTMRRSC